MPPQALLLLLSLSLISAQETVPYTERVDCHPDPNTNQEDCDKRKCIWDDTASNGPRCYFPRNTGYTFVSTTNGETHLQFSQNGAPCPFGDAIQFVTFSKSTIGSVLNVKIGGKNSPEALVSLPKKPTSSKESFEVTLNTAGTFSFAVKRTSTGTKVWDTSIGGLIIAEQFIQIASFLPTKNFFGLGEHVNREIMHDLSGYTTWGMFARDEAPTVSGLATKNLYSVHPFYIVLESDGLAHGVFILNTHAQEVTTGPGPHIVYRAIGGMLDIYFFPGPTAEEVVKQYLGIIGTPFLPPYWALGSQLSRYAYNKSLSALKDTVEIYRNADIYMDVVQIDIRYMKDNMDFTLGEDWKELGEYADKLHEMGMHLILMFHPAIDVTSDAFKNAMEADVSFIEWESKEKVQSEIQNLYPLANSTKIMLAAAQPYQHSAFPDFLDPLSNTANWWIQEFKNFHNKVAFDGIWMDMDEPAATATNEQNPGNIASLWCSHANDNSTNIFDKPLYETVNAFSMNGTLASKTVCMSGLTGRGSHRVYETKNIYGLSEAVVTQKALQEATGKRGATIFRSTFPSAGRYGGHYLGDTSVGSYDFENAVIGIQEFNMFGIPYVGADSVGFNGVDSADMCRRWNQLGAAYPFSRIYNCVELEHSSEWEATAASMRAAIRYRYQYLPYLYSLHFEAAMNGGTVVRPLFFEFPNDTEKYNLGTQFMWGPGLMFAPVYAKGVSTAFVEFPSPALWYNMMDWGRGRGAVISPPDEMFPTYARGGFIIPMQDPAQTTAQSRLMPLGIVVPFDSDGKATGQLYWDDGESIVTDFETHNYYHFTFNAVQSLATTTITIERKRTAENVAIPSLDAIDLFGLKYVPLLGTTELNGNFIGNKLKMESYEYDGKYGRILIREKGFLILNATGADKYTITWKNIPVQSEEDILPKEERVNCLPEIKEPTEWVSDIAQLHMCQLRGCIYHYTYFEYSTPMCFFRKNTGYYANDISGDVVKLIKGPHSGTSPFGKDIENLDFSILSDSPRLHIRIGDSSRYIPNILPESQAPLSTETLTVEKSQGTGIFSFIVRRQSTKQIIWDTSIGGLIFSDQYVQIAAYIGGTEIYGIGENAHQKLSLNIDDRYETWALLARDEPPNSSLNDKYRPDTKNLYGVHVFYVGMEESGLAHGVFILNSNPQEITVGPAPHLVYRAIGGLLDIYFFPGPLPEDVVHQYLSLVGTPLLPSYWSLGFQLSRYGYSSLQEMKDTVSAVQGAGIPLDVLHADMDYMHEYQDFTIGTDWSDFGEYVKRLHNESLHVIVTLHPAVTVSGDPFQRGVQNYKANFLEWERMDQVQREVQDKYELTKDTKIMLGVGWPNEHVAFPDFSSDNTAAWWKKEIDDFHKQVPFDGLWITMNEPSAFGTNEDHPFYFDLPYHSNITPLKCPTEGDDAKYDIPPFETHSVYKYRPDTNQSYLATKTVCMLAVTHDGKRMYDVKNLYGLQEAIVTSEALKETLQKRPVITSRSTFPTSGHYTGHWLGDNSATWDDLRSSIIGIQEFNMFGIPHVGADICGFAGNTTEELCIRWQQLGAFYPLSRNHNDRAAIPQHPTVWESVATAARKSNLFRYRYLPYLYTLHFEASRDGRTVVRPVFFEFPEDHAARLLNHQFMWGSAIMIVGVTEPDVTSVTGYLPRAADWYSLRDSDYGVLQEIGYQNYAAAKDDVLPVFIRAGTIVPRQAAEMTTVLSRTNPIELLIANDKTNGAKGTFVFDDGESIVDSYETFPHYAAEITFSTQEFQSTLTISRTSANVNMGSDVQMPTLDIIEIFGFEYYPILSTFKGGDAEVDLSASLYDANTKRLLIKGKGLVNLLKAKDIQLTWNNTKEPTAITTTTTTAKTTTTTTAKAATTTTTVTTTKTGTTTTTTRATPMTTVAATTVSYDSHTERSAFMIFAIVLSSVIAFFVLLQFILLSFFIRMVNQV